MDKNIILRDKEQFRQGMKDYFSYRAKAPIQAFINSIAFPKTMDDLLFFIQERGLLNPELIMISDKEEWSVPRWCKKGDIVLFMTTVTSSQSISRVRAEIKRSKSMLSDKEYRLLKYGLMREESLYKNIGGCIFAVGKVSGKIKTYPDETWVFADISDIQLLEEPIPYDQFKEKVPVSKAGSITPVYSDKYEYLKQQLAKNNHLPSYVIKSRSEPIREASITKNNWLDVAKYYRFHYTLEEQFRKAFVDYLLKEISDDRKLYSECYCFKSNRQYGYIDNVIKFNGKYLPVEVKLDVNLESDLIGQVAKYCNLNLLNLTKNKSLLSMDSSYTQKVLIIDTYGLYLYDDEVGNYFKIYDFFTLQTMQDLSYIKDILESYISGDVAPVRPAVHINGAVLEKTINFYRTEMVEYRESIITEKTEEIYADTIQCRDFDEDYLIERYLIDKMTPEDALAVIDTIELD